MHKLTLFRQSIGVTLHNNSTVGSSYLRRSLDGTGVLGFLRLLKKSWKERTKKCVHIAMAKKVFSKIEELKFEEISFGNNFCLLGSLKSTSPKAVI